MPKFSRSTWLLVLAALFWVALLLGTLGQGNAGIGPGVNWAHWLALAAQGGFAACVFIFARIQTGPLRGHNFLGTLRQLFWRALALTAGLLVVEGIAWLEPNTHTNRAVDYTIALALFIGLLSQTLYTWRALVSFRGGARLRREWLVFELLLGALLLFQLTTWVIPPPLRLVVYAAIGIFGIYLCGHQRWVAYLSTSQKTQAILLQLGILGFLVLFLLYLRQVQADPTLAAPAAQQSFLLLASFFAVVYAVAGLLVSLFNLPVADVYEQRRTEFMSLQQLSQVIQRGKTPQEIYQNLLNSIVQTLQADAAWLDPHFAEADGEEVTPITYQLSADAAGQLRDRLANPAAGPAHELVDNDLERSQLLQGLGLTGYGSLALLPLHNGGPHNFGTLVLLKMETESFEPDDLSVLHTFITQAALSLENLQLVREAQVSQRTQDELRIAALVQERLIPKQLPTDNWFEISTYAQAAKEVGGDFYDFLHLPGQKLAVLIGDVSGKGVTAAFHTAQMKGIFHALMQPNPLAKSDRQRFPDPHRFMVQANEALTHCLERSSFITAAFYLIDYQAGGFSFARAGHCHTLYYHSIKEEVSYFHTEGLGLGIIRNDNYGKHVKTQFWDYNPGDVMVIYTDGIVEARNAAGDEYGENRLREMLGECFYQSAEGINAYIRNDVQQFSLGQPLHDDQTLLVVKFKASQPQQ
ncbi:SpoIIE family protein phosphatase [Hymenobacter sp. RP-2-7]|uniref:SpoIIE family protein phosphatase n=1 Tax=Hymenobacter polaris TaxID=2682546 RepID=A0A7Y0AHF6_9BACT|nr:GAF domain-containing SpoIIE family protein phosphatase [Hymenobacter polaris]NML67360.1 SpoIIE family protein phosphatase [Hymenobacter polaris]